MKLLKCLSFSRSASICVILRISSAKDAQGIESHLSGLGVLGSHPRLHLPPAQLHQLNRMRHSLQDFRGAFDNPQTFEQETSSPWLNTQIVANPREASLRCGASGGGELASDAREARQVKTRYLIAPLEPLKSAFEQPDKPARYEGFRSTVHIGASFSFHYFFVIRNIICLKQISSRHRRGALRSVFLSVLLDRSEPSVSTMP